MGDRIDFIVPPGAVQEDCRSCGRPMTFIPTMEGNELPLDLLTVVTLPNGERRAESHYAHCDNPARFRKAKGKR